MPSERRPRLTPPIADVRRAVRAALQVPRVEERPQAASRNPNAEDLETRSTLLDPHSARSPLLDPQSPLALVALSGGADSLALAAATAFEASRAGWRAGAVVVDHRLQPGSSEQADAAASVARDLGLDPVLVRRVDATAAPGGAGPEGAARAARYAALDAAAAETGAELVLLGHTLDDQAETVLLGLARGSGAASLAGMASRSGAYARPLLGISRATTRQACLDAGLEPWDDPHNSDSAYARVRVRERVLPVLEAELGPGVAEALARTAEQLREDEQAFADQIDEFVEEICEPAEAGIAVSVAALDANPAALRQRIIRHVVASEFGVALTRGQTLEVARLVTDWHGQGPIDLPRRIRASRAGPLLRFQYSGVRSAQFRREATATTHPAPDSPTDQAGREQHS